jgi:RNA recognition motif-containing protein
MYLCQQEQSKSPAEADTRGSFLTPPRDWDESSNFQIQSNPFTDDITWLYKLIDDDDPSPVDPPNHSPLTQFTFFGELEDRRVEITNIHPEINEEEIRRIGSSYGDVNEIDFSQKHKGKVFMKFFDIRSAHAMRKESGKVRDHSWFVQFAEPEPITDPKHPPNNGTIVIFNSFSNVLDSDIHAEFSKFGEIRDIRTSKSDSRSTKKKGKQKFIEFWDIRASEQALRLLKEKEVLGQKIPVEFSRPGGFRKNPGVFKRHRIPNITRQSKTGKSPLDFIITTSRGQCDVA